MRRLAVVLVVGAACARSAPATRYYELAPPGGAAPARGELGAPARGELVLAIEPLETDPAYDDERIVYRANAYRLDYYHYHRWSAPPGVMIGNFLERALERSGRFRAVIRDGAGRASVVLGGRVIAIEEVDAAPDRWLGRVVLELVLTDPATGDVVWTEQVEATEPLPDQSPEGLARALSVAMGRVADRVAPAIAKVATRVANADHSPSR